MSRIGGVSHREQVQQGLVGDALVGASVFAGRSAVCTSALLGVCPVLSEHLEMKSEGV